MISRIIKIEVETSELFDLETKHKEKIFLAPIDSLLNRSVLITVPNYAKLTGSIWNIEMKKREHVQQKRLIA